MPTTTYKVLGQTAPAATTATTLYTVPANTQAVSSSIVACNRGATAGTYSIAVRPAGAALANQHYIVFEAALPGDSTDAATLGMTLATTDVVTVWASTGDFSFSLFGSEITP